MTEPITVAPDRTELLVVWLGFPVLGTALGTGLAAAAGWLVEQPVPFRGVFGVLDSLDDPVGLVVGAFIGLLLGLAVAKSAEDDYLRVTVGAERIRLVRGQLNRTVSVAKVAGAFRQGKHLVLLDADGDELVRERGDVNSERLAAAFQARGIPWLAAPPPE